MLRDDTEQNVGILKLLPSIAVSAAIGLTVTLLLLFFAALLISGSVVDYTWNVWMTAGGCVLGTLVGGFLSARAAGRRVLLIGLLTGFLYYLVLLIAGSLFFARILPDNGVIAMLASSLIGGALGGLLASGLRRRR